MKPSRAVSRSTHSPSRTRLVGAALTVALVIAACGAEDTGSAPLPAGELPAFASSASVASLDDLTEEVESAIADAAERFDVDPMVVAVAGALRVTWSNGALGCPEDGMMYTEALVDGYLLTLEVDGRRVAYHGADGQPPFFCEQAD
jgi:predicted Mrr-cat superfamily restriction endonuclease